MRQVQLTAALLAFSVTILTFQTAIASEITLPIVAEGVKNSEVTIWTDENIDISAAPSRNITREVFNYILSSADDQPTLPDIYYKQIEAMGLRDEKIYYYAAVDRALTRIFKNRMLFDRDTSKESIPDKNVRNFDKLRIFLQVQQISDAHLRVEIYHDKNAFDARAARIGLHTVGAFWDPARSTIGVYSNPRPLKWLPLRASSAGGSDARQAALVRDYIFYRLIGDLGHELVHFAQSSAGAQGGIAPFLAESRAIFLQQNIAFRQEIAVLGGAQSASGVPLATKDPICKGLLDASPLPFSADGLRAAREFVDSPDLEKTSVSKFMTLTDAEFYGQSPDALRRAYAIGPLAVLYFASMDEGDFRRLFGETGRLDLKWLLANSEKVDSGFRDYARGVRDQYGSSEQRRKEVDLVASAVDRCSDEGYYAYAVTGARIMMDLAPEDPDGPLYVGDVFWRTDMPLIALDYYAIANEIEQKVETTKKRILIKSRYADALMTIGERDKAIEFYSGVVSMPAEAMSLDDLIPYLRSSLNLKFLTYAKRGGKDPGRSPYLLANSYVRQFQENTCQVRAGGADDGLMSLAARGDLKGAKELLKHRFEITAADMDRELKQDDWVEVLRVRDQRCG